MDSALLTNLFRRLFSHRTCSRWRSIPLQRTNNSTPKRQYHEDTGRESHWQQKTDYFPEDKMKEFKKYPMVTAAGLRHRWERPKRVKMLTRDFIEDSLYNPNYGYFSKQAVIFTPGEPFDFNTLANEDVFHHLLGRRFTEFEDKLDAQSHNETRQLWYTPTELFRPYYGEAIARYLVESYRASQSENEDLSHGIAQAPIEDLIIYEMGAGNGTLMINVLDFIRLFHPEVYKRTKYKVIEISSSLASIQSSQLASSASARGHAAHVEIINRSIFSWDRFVSARCYFLALEVIDNFAHDAIRYDPFTEEPLQGTVLIDSAGEFYEFYTRDIDPVATRFLKVRNISANRPFDHPLESSALVRKIKFRLPLAANLTVPEYIPTRLMEFFDILRDYFPRHQLLTGDFHFLPGTIQGIGSPAVQTRYQRRVVPVTTLLVLQGYFDILFPTNFPLMEDIYHAMTGRPTRVLTQKDFLRRWAYIKDTRTRSGENPMLSWYENASIMTTI